MPFKPAYYTYTQPFNGFLSGTTWVGRYLKKHSPTHTHPDHQTSFIILFHSVTLNLLIKLANMSQLVQRQTLEIRGNAFTQLLDKKLF